MDTLDSWSDAYSHQIQLRESDIAKTTFTIRYGAFKCLVMPFGLCNARATFQRMTNTILQEGLDRYVLVFPDNILSYSCPREEHEQHIHAILKRLQEKKFLNQLKKCGFLYTKVEHFGFYVVE